MLLHNVGSPKKTKQTPLSLRINPSVSLHRLHRLNYCALMVENRGGYTRVVAPEHVSRQFSLNPLRTPFHFTGFAS